MPLDLLVPDLLTPIDAPPEMRALRLPAIEKWLARADILRVEARSAASWLAAAFGLPAPAPVAPVALAAEGRVADGAWLRADPVHLRIDRDTAAMHSAAILEIGRDEADALVAALQAHFRQDGIEFFAPSPDRWYARVPEGELPETTPLEEVLGRNVFGLLPVAKGKLNWRSALTEAQMLLAGHEVNARRESDRRPTINSVWFWGGGTLPEHVASPYSAVHADEIFAQGLATLSQTHLSGVPAAVADLPDARPGDRLLVVVDALTRALHRGDAAQWREEAAKLERGWFAGMGEAIGRFGSVRIILPAPKDTTIACLQRSSRWRWLRRRKALAAYA